MVTARLVLRWSKRYRGGWRRKDQLAVPLTITHLELVSFLLRIFSCLHIGCRTKVKALGWQSPSGSQKADDVLAFCIESDEDFDQSWSRLQRDSIIQIEPLEADKIP